MRQRWLAISLVTGVFCAAIFVLGLIQGRRRSPPESHADVSKHVNSASRTKLLEKEKAPPKATEDPRAQAEFEIKWWSTYVKQYSASMRIDQSAYDTDLRALTVIGRNHDSPEVRALIAQLDHDDAQNRRIVLSVKSVLNGKSDLESSVLAKVATSFLDDVEHVHETTVHLESAKQHLMEATRRSGLAALKAEPAVSSPAKREKKR